METVLSEDHRAVVDKIRLKAAAGCSACRYDSCAKCCWKKAVRYWRRLETAGRFAGVEGYSRLMKAPTKMTLE